MEAMKTLIKSLRATILSERGTANPNNEKESIAISDQTNSLPVINTMIANQIVLKRYQMSE